MIEVVPGNHIITELDGEFVVCRTKPNRLIASHVLRTETGLERLGFQGTKEHEDVGRVAIIGDWEPGRIATALTRTYYSPGEGEDRELFDRMREMQIIGLGIDLADSQPFLVEELSSDEAAQLIQAS